MKTVRRNRRTDGTQISEMGRNIPALDGEVGGPFWPHVHEEDAQMDFANTNTDFYARFWNSPRIIA